MRLRLALVAVVLAVLGLVAGPAHASAAPKQGPIEVTLQVVASYGAPLYARADQGSRLINYLECGTFVTQIRRYEPGQMWYRVRDEQTGQKGWVNGWLIWPDLSPHDCSQELPDGLEWSYGRPAAEGWAAQPTTDNSSESADITTGDTATSPAQGDGDIIDIICAAAAAYGQSCDDMVRVATCESGLDPSNYTPPYDAEGLFQFLPDTWASTPYAAYDRNDPWASAMAAGWMWANGRRGEWVCQ